MEKRTEQNIGPDALVDYNKLRDVGMKLCIVVHSHYTDWRPRIPLHDSTVSLPETEQNHAQNRDGNSSNSSNDTLHDSTESLTSIPTEKDAQAASDTGIDKSIDITDTLSKTVNNSKCIYCNQSFHGKELTVHMEKCAVEAIAAYECRRNENWS